MILKRWLYIAEVELLFFIARVLIVAREIRLAIWRMH